MSVIIDGFDVSDTDDWWGWTYTGGKAARGFVEPAARADFFNEIALARMAQHGPGAVKVYPASRGRSYFYTYERPFVADTVTGRAWEGIRAAWVYSGDDPAMARVFGCCTGPAVIDPFTPPSVAYIGGWRSNGSSAIIVPADLTDSLLLVFAKSLHGTLPMTATYGATTLTPISGGIKLPAPAGGEFGLQGFYMLNPPADPAGGGAQLAISPDAYRTYLILQSVDTADPIGDVVEDSGTGTTSGPGTIPGGASTVKVNAVWALQGAGFSDPTPDASQTEAWSVSNVGNAIESGGGYGSDTPTWTHTNSKPWLAVGVAVNGA